MEDQTPSVPENPAQSFGTTMRIELSPELIEEARARAVSQPVKPRRPVVTIPKARPEIEGAGLDFQQLLQNIYDAAFITELSGEIIMVNVRANHSFHAEGNQLVHRNILELFSGAEQTLLPTILDALQSNRFVLMQAFCARTDGTFFPAEISVNRLHLGNKDRLSFFVRDITLRKEQEDRLRTGSTALQNASSGIAIAGMDARIEYCNPAFADLFRFDESTAAVGRELAELVREPDKLAAILEKTARQETWEGELEMRCADGSAFFAQTSVAPNFNADDEQVGVVLSVLDITPLKRAQKQLEEYAAELHLRNRQMQEDLDLAGELTEALLPARFLAFPASRPPEQAPLHFRHFYLPSGRIGGDFFDIRPLSEYETGFLIADVMGHGVRAALVVATIRGMLQELHALARDPGALLTQINANYTAIFKKSGTDVTFATALYGVLDTRTGLWKFANASHPAPRVLRRAGSRVLRVQGTVQPHTAALGLFRESSYATSQFQLEPGDLLLLYTDGFSEVENAAHQLYESERLEAALREHLADPPADLLPALVSDARRFAGSDSFEDDVCLLSAHLLRLEPGNNRSAAS